jgi:mannosyltransferase OCH1-like enzyme
MPSPRSTSRVPERNGGGSSDPPPIPRTVHRLWLGGPEPDWTAGFGASWERPGWELRQWDEPSVEDLFPLVNQSIYDRARRLCPKNAGQLRADVLRYEILLRFGGQGRWINNAIMGAAAGHPFVERLVRSLPANVRRHRGARPNVLSGPQFLTRCARGRRDLTIFDQRLFYPYGYREIADHAPGEEWPASTYAVHHWANQRRERGVPVG